MPRVTLAASVFFFQNVHAGAQKKIFVFCFISCVDYYVLVLVGGSVERAVRCFRGSRVGEVRYNRTALKFLLFCYIEIFAFTSRLLFFKRYIALTV